MAHPSPTLTIGGSGTSVLAGRGASISKKQYVSEYLPWPHDALGRWAVGESGGRRPTPHVP